MASVKRRVGKLQRIAAARGLACDHVDHVVREQSAVAQRAVVGDEADTIAALDQLDAERFGGKQMAAGAAGGKEDERLWVHERLIT